MANLPLPFFERPVEATGGPCCSTLVRFERAERVGGGSEWSPGSSGLDSRADALRFRVEPARALAGGGGGCGGTAVEEADDCLADERVTLDDMRN